MSNDAVARLKELVPPPVGNRQAFDWNSVENELGRTLPDDYKELAEVYGAGLFDRYVLVHVPDESRDHVDLSKAVQEGRERLEYFAAKGETLPYRPDELLQVASTDNGDSIYWAAPGGRDPDNWTIVVTGPRDQGHCVVG
ncbi:SMI1/KNR4 family protein [Actinoplanes sp. NPDC020271]|uniref:SMI1/KNR4 family protein n=1 Tax=Actinoplanes sp. NPDC020271 TaxID=3363896 RepID=UPI0037A1714C